MSYVHTMLSYSLVMVFLCLFVAGLCRVLQRAGDVLYVPRHYTHSVLNVQEDEGGSVGFAVEVMNYVY